MSLTTLDLLDRYNFQRYNRNWARELGSVNAAIMLSVLFEMHYDNDEPNNFIDNGKYGGGWFCYTVDKCEEMTVLSRKEQESAIKILEKYNLFEKKNMGVPPKRHFRLKVESFCAN